MLSPSAKEYNGGISENAHFFRMFDYFALDLREQHIFGNVNKQHNGSLTLFRYTFPAMLKFCSIETTFRERQISSFILSVGLLLVKLTMRYISMLSY